MASQASRPGAGGNSAGGGGRLAQFKLVLLGESAVGKSSLVLRFVKGQFHEFQVSSISIFVPSFIFKMRRSKEGKISYKIV